MNPKEHYNRFDFIKDEEKVYTHISKGNDGLIPHSHDFSEIVMVTSGHGTHIINGATYHVMPGDIFLLLPTDIHSFVPLDEDNKFNWLSCIWIEDFFEIDDDLLIKTKKFSDEYTYDIYNQLLDIHNEFYSKKEGYLKVIKYLMQVIVLKLYRLARNHEIDYGTRHKNKLVKEAVNYINENYTKNIELNDVANHLMISQVYLCKLFKIQMQTGVMQYLRMLRINKAMQLITSTDLNIDVISTMVGFSDIKSLYSLFKKRTGVSPGEFRKHYNN